MRTIFRDKRISGLLAVLPATVLRFDDEVENYSFPAKQTMRLKKVMGYKQHRIAKDTTATSDLAAAGLTKLFDEGKVKKEDIGGIVVSCAYPDHFIPPVSNILQGKFGLSEEVFCMDTSQGCGGFIIACSEAMMLLEHLPEGKKVLAITADAHSPLVSRRDRNSWPLAGDASGIAVVENNPEGSTFHTIIRNHGDMGNALMIPAGCSRMRSTPETAISVDRDGDGNYRALDNLRMNGSEVFNYVQTKVPTLIDDVLAYAGVQKEEIDTFLFHQPNRFMLKKLAEKLEVPYEKVPMNVVEEFGNSSGSTIPVCATYNCAQELVGEKKKYCLAAFGSGLMVGGMVGDLGGMDFCEMLISDC